MSEYMRIRIKILRKNNTFVEDRELREYNDTILNEIEREVVQ